MGELPVGLTTLTAQAEVLGWKDDMAGNHPC